MSRYIDADKLGIGRADPKIFNNPEYANGWNSAIEIIDKAPTADVKEVKHGQWNTVYDGSILEHYNSDVYSLTCSICGNTEKHISKFCPSCGARMDGGNEE